MRFAIYFFIQCPHPNIWNRFYGYRFNSFRDIREYVFPPPLIPKYIELFENENGINHYEDCKTGSTGTKKHLVKGVRRNQTHETYRIFAGFKVYNFPLNRHVKMDGCLASNYVVLVKSQC